jgi:hypothetical protein
MTKRRRVEVARIWASLRPRHLCTADAAGGNGSQPIASGPACPRGGNRQPFDDAAARAPGNRRPWSRTRKPLYFGLIRQGIAPGKNLADLTEVPLGAFRDQHEVADPFVLTYDSCRACGECMSGSSDQYRRTAVAGTGDRSHAPTVPGGVDVVSSWIHARWAFAVHARIIDVILIIDRQQMPCQGL